MCGILGSVNIEMDRSTLDVIIKRGPDDWGLTDYQIADKRLWFGHRRLSIVDLSPAGRQPMTTSDGKFSIVFNGEIYNHSDIRSTLTQKEFRGHSDTETILYALAERGIEAVGDFNGIFGFAFLDIERQILYIARDPFGVKPVYYVAAENRFAFCSEIKPLLKLLPSEIDADALDELLRLRYLPSPDTLFKNIRKVLPGHYLTIDLKSMKTTETAFLAALPPKIAGTSQDLLRGYAERFEAAVRRQLMSDVDVGILLSGGVDSALVACAAQKFSQKRLPAFTVGFNGQYVEDEIEKAAETAKFLGLEHHVVRIDDRDFFEKIERVVRIVEEPLATTSAIPMLALSELAASNVKVVLTGQGADEPLAGYGRYQGEWLFQRIPTVLAAILGRCIPTGKIKNQTLARGLKLLGTRDDLTRFLAAYEVFSPNEIERLTGRKYRDRAADYYRRYYDLLKCGNRRSSVERMTALDARMNLADDLLLYTDKITMNFSLECRVPLLDIPLVSYIESLPVEEKITFRKGKVIHKKYAETVLPKEIVYRPKLGFASPTQKWFRNESTLRDIFIDEASPFDRYFSKDYVGDILKQHASGFNRERHIFLLLCVKYWMDSFLKETF